jgi:arylsulfatase A-like enzyme
MGNCTVMGWLLAPALAVTILTPGCLHQKTPNIVLVVMDTVRQDHLSCYGYDRATSPNVSELTKTSTVYSNAYSTSCWTAPAHASLFTGLFPVAHRSTQENPDLQPELVTLAEILNKEGYQTFGITENGVLHHASNFCQGFDEYYETWILEDDYGDENPACAIFAQLLRKRDRSNPFFVFVNLIAAHAPYEPPTAFFAKVSTGLPRPECSGESWRDYFLGRIDHSADDFACIQDHYDAEVMYVDDLVGRMMSEVKSAGLWENTVFIATSDHGENLGDHEMLFHVFNLYETTTRVPLIIHYPKLFRSGMTDSRIVQLVDLFPTLLTIAGADVRLYPSHGISLLDEDVTENRSVVCEYYYPNQALRVFGEKDRDHPRLAPFKRRLRSITEDGMKLVVGSDGRNELYDLRIDPNEQKNLIDHEGYGAEKRDLGGRLKATLSSYSRDAIAVSGLPSEPIDEATKRQLRSLGYME